MKQGSGNLRYFLSDAWDECTHSPGVNLLAVSTLAAALFVAGLVLLVLFNVGAWVERLRGDVRVDVYLQDDLDQETLTSLEESLAKTDGVARVEFIDKKEALRRFRESFHGLADLPEELGSNPLPASLEVFLAPGPGAGETARLIIARTTGVPGVEEVRFDQDWLDRLEALLDLATWGGVVMALVVFAAVAFVMASVLRLAVHARRDEIDIMLLVGATPAFVRGPFLVAGAAQGLLASLVAILLVELVRRLSLAYAGTGTVALLDFVAGSTLPLHLAALLVAIGLAVSLTGAFFAVRRSV